MSQLIIKTHGQNVTVKNHNKKLSIKEYNEMFKTAMFAIGFSIDQINKIRYDDKK